MKKMEETEQKKDCNTNVKNVNNSGEIEQVKSRAVVKYSSVPLPTDFARLQCNTNLNVAPANWLTSFAESYGLEHSLENSTSFSSFRMGHMFPDCITEVDVISDAENVKKLLKIPYSRNPVSMIVHCTEKTLLIDEFDFHKHLLRTSESDWQWLKKVFSKYVVQTISEKGLGVSAKNSRHALEERALVSKFLHYSLTEPVPEGEPLTEQTLDNKYETLSKSWPPLPEPKPEEQLPDHSTTHQTYNRNVVWTFENIQMLLGTNLPIFGGTTHPCISLRLRDANKRISVLTGIDYWLDNLMCNVPEVLMCYHLDGLVQRYELIKTEDLPNLDDSKFSPNLIRGVAQHILSFLKSNATKAGHTYWLFKGKDEDFVKLYDLTSLCSETLADQNQNPFTVPVAMLLYRVARNMKQSMDPSTGTIRALLNNCLNLLDKEKFPQIVTSAHYMLSDLYLPLGMLKEELIQSDKKSSSCPTPPDHDTSDLIHTMSISDYLDSPPIPSYEPPPPLIGSIVERCEQALQHVVSGLQCLHFYDVTSPTNDSTSDQSKNDSPQEPEKAHPHRPIPMAYSSLSSEKKNEDKPTDMGKTPVTTSTKKKNKKNKNSAKNADKTSNDSKPNTKLIDKNADSNRQPSPVSFLNPVKTAYQLNQTVMPLPTWQAPSPSDSVWWKGHLKTLLYEKACLIYSALAEKEVSNKRYGKSLYYAKLVLLSHAHMAAGCGRPCTTLVSGALSLAGDSCLHIAYEFPNNIDKHRSDFQNQSPADKALLAEMEVDIAPDKYPYEVRVFPEILDTKERLMLSSVTCYSQAIISKPFDVIQSRLGNVHNDLSTLYMDHVNELFKNNLADNMAKVNTLLGLAEYHVQCGLDKFMKLKDKSNTALLHANYGRLKRMRAVYCTNGVLSLQIQLLKEALGLYDKALEPLGSRKAAPNVWDVISWERSTALLNMVQLYQDNPPRRSEKNREEAEREMQDILNKAIQSCDLKTASSYYCKYQFRAAMLHKRLASFYHCMYRERHESDKGKHILHLALFNYERSASLMEQLEHPVNYLSLQLERVALQELIAEISGASIKLKALQTALDYLLSCSSVINALAEQPTSPTSDNKKTQESETKKLFKIYKERVEFILKSLVKVTITSEKHRKSRLSAKYKEMYSLALTQESEVSLPVKLSKMVVSLISLMSCSTGKDEKNV